MLSPKKVHWLLLRALLFALLCAAAAGPAVAAVNCNSSISISPPLPSRIVVTPSTAVGTVVYRGTVTSMHNCSGTESSARGYLHTLVNGGTSPVAMSPNSTLGLQSTSAGTINYAAGGGCPAVASAYSLTTTKQLMGFFWGAGVSFSNCSFKITLPVDLVVMQLPVSTASVTGSGTVVGQCGNTLPWACTDVSTDGSTINIQTIGTGTNIAVDVVGGCTLAASNYSVLLPDVATKALKVPGQIAGRTPFALVLTGCSAGSYSVQARWQFQEGPVSGVIANSATQPAAYVGVQILNDAMVGVTNGGLSTLAGVTGAGTYSITYYAQYYALGAAQAGAVAGAATFVLTYE